MKPFLPRPGIVRIKTKATSNQPFPWITILLSDTLAFPHPTPGSAHYPLQLYAPFGALQSARQHVPKGTTSPSGSLTPSRHLLVYQKLISAERPVDQEV